MHPFQWRWRVHPRGTSGWSLPFLLSHCCLDPGQKAEDSGVDIWSSPILFSTGHNALDDTITHEQALGVTLWAETARTELTFFSYFPLWCPGWSLLGTWADIRALLVLSFHQGIANPTAPPTGSSCPYMTLGQCSHPRDTGQRLDRRTGWGHRDRVHSDCHPSSHLSWPKGLRG